MLKEAETAVRAAGQLLMSYYEKLGSDDVGIKPDGGGLVTKADTDAENLLFNELSKLDSSLSFFGEETGEHAGGNGRWIVDPLDGTSNFAHGLPWFAVSVGLEKTKGESDLELGIIYDPVREDMFSAERGKGAFLNGKPIRVSTKTDVEQGMVATGFYYHKGEKLQDAIRIFGNVHQHVATVRRFGSAAMDLAYVAYGKLDGFWERGLSPWDVAAGTLITREAGGNVTNYDGTQYRIYDETILAASDCLHSPLKQLIRHQ